jgi:hypothetical protein
LHQQSLTLTPGSEVDYTLGLYQSIGDALAPSPALLYFGLIFPPQVIVNSTNTLPLPNLTTSSLPLPSKE